MSTLLGRSAVSVSILALVAGLTSATPATASAQDRRAPGVDSPASVPVETIGVDRAAVDDDTRASRVTRLDDPTWPVVGTADDLVVGREEASSDKVDVALRAPKIGKDEFTATVEVVEVEEGDEGNAPSILYSVEPADEAPAAPPNGSESSEEPVPAPPTPTAPEDSEESSEQREAAPSDPAPETDTAPAADGAGESNRLPSTPLEVTISYADFAQAYGGDWASRLRLTVVEDCDPATGTECDVVEVPSTNDPVEQTVTAQLPASSMQRSGATTMAMSASSAGSSGDFSATPLAASSSWSAGGQTGDFSWSYPLELPPGLEGPEPDLAIAYNSASVDGRSSSTNNQSGWVGEGFSLEPGFIERSYASCDDDKPNSNVPSDTGDMCWKGQNLTISFGERSSAMVRKGTGSEWRMESDDGTRIERVEGAANGARDGEYWVVTTTDGTRYFFGRNRVSGTDEIRPNSVNTVPVYGNNAGEPCHSEKFADSRCNQAWRWNLDYVVDAQGSSMSYFYNQETNKYAANKGGSDVSYDRASTLARIDYGTRAGSETTAKAPARVLFDVSERCIDTESSACPEKISSSTKSRWPDVPFDLICTEDCDHLKNRAPSFFSTKRLTGIRSQVLDASGAAYEAVDAWTLKQSFPSPGDGSSPSLWLSAIARTGKTGTDLDANTVTFGGSQLENRVESPDDGAPPFIKWRVTSIANGTGGITNVNYRPADCSANDLPSKSNLDSNTKRCFPVRFQAFGESSPRIHFFNKYVVDEVIESDNTAFSPDVVTRYSYKGAPAWHFDDNNIVREKHRSWSEWRGYGVVGTTVGSGSNTSYTETAFMRGMYGDRTTQDGVTRTTTVDYDGSGDLRDHADLNGFVRGTKTTLGEGGQEVTRSINDPWRSAATASSNGLTARMVDVAETETRTRLSSGAFRTTRESTTFNDNGLPTRLVDRGDLATTADDTCVSTSYAENDATGLVDLPAVVTTTVGTCATPPSSADDVINSTRTYYDGHTSLTAAPDDGHATKVESFKGWNGGPSYQTDTVSTFDAYGRTTSETDAEGNVTTTAYSPASGRQPTQVVTTNPRKQKSTVTLNRAWGSPVKTVEVSGATTEVVYDSLGRISKVWNPGRDRAAGQSESLRYTYTSSTSNPNHIKTERLNSAGNYVTSFEFFDGLLRPRSTQEPAASDGGGRIVTATHYDNRGLVVSQRGPFFNSQPVSSTMVGSADNETPVYTEFTYDRADRPTVETTKSYGVTQWSTTTAYGGDRTMVKPPSGGTPTTTIVDAQGRTRQLLQHHGAEPSGAADTTTYSYTPAGQLAKVVNQAGTEWRYEYDARGRMVRAVDPDKGTSATTYDVLDRPVSTTDARNNTLWTKYDELGRELELRDDDASGVLRTSFTYDATPGPGGTLVAGLPSSATRHTDKGAYTNSVASYDIAGRPLELALSVPAGDTDFHRAGGYVSKLSYNPDGSLRTQALPQAEGLPGEQLRWTYDALGNVKSLSGFSSIVVDTMRTPQGDVLQRRLGNTVNKDVYDTYEYDDINRLSRHHVSLQGSATTRRMDLRYGYDQSGKVVKLNDVAQGDTAQTSASTDRQCFKYDHLERLTEAWSSSTNTCAAATTSTLGSVAPYWDRFTYDSSGNRKTWREVTRATPTAAVRDVTHTSTYPSPTGENTNPHAPDKVVDSGSATGTETFQHDEAGNMTARSSAAGAQTMIWDREGRMKSATKKVGGVDKQLSYTYDAFGNRLIKRDEAAGTVTLTVGNTEITKQLGGSGTKSSQRNYTVDGQLVGTRVSGGYKVQVVDHVGTPIMEVDGASQAATKRRYQPFGGVRQAATVATNRNYVNRQSDSFTGTLHLGAREYDPRLGRFLSADPVVDPFDPQQMNGYAYANNSPISLQDADGLWPNWGKVKRWGKKAFRNTIFDYRKCRGVSWGCAGEVGMALPWGKAFKVAKYVFKANPRFRPIINRFDKPARPRPKPPTVQNRYRDPRPTPLAKPRPPAPPRLAREATPPPRALKAPSTPGKTSAAGRSVPGPNNARRDVVSGRFTANPNKAGSGSNASSSGSVHGNSRSSSAETHLYRLEDSDGNLLKWGITNNLKGRYSSDFMIGKNLRPMTSGSRDAMLNLERWIVERDAGPLNLEPWAGRLG